MKLATVNDIESLRGELFHMILFSVAWALIGEYLLDFHDYALGIVLTLIAAVCLALYSIRLYDLESELESTNRIMLVPDRSEGRWDKAYAMILLLEGVAVVATWSILLKYGHDNWVVPSFALIAGLHFLPLARLVRLNSYYYLGAWICIVAAAGYWLFTSGRMVDSLANTLIAYGCAAGAVLDGIIIAVRVHRELRS